MIKRCTNCRIKKDLGEFYKSKSNQDNLHPICKECYKEIYKKRYKLPEVKEKYKKYNRTSILKKHNLTIKEYEEMLKQQYDKCAICGKPETIKQRGKIQALSIDHDHKTGKVRGLLCSRCNVLLGFLHEDIHFILKIINYLHIYKSIN